MTKELEYVEELKLRYQEKIGVIRRLNAIETVLKNYEELTNKPLILYGRTHGHTQSIIKYICKNYKEVKITNLEDEKKLKALEIIKEYFVLINEYGKVSLEPKNFIPEDKVKQLKEVLL